MEGAQRQQILLDALWPPSEGRADTHGTFAVCEVIKYSQGFVLKSFHVEGAGELQLPLSAENTLKLRGVCEQAPFGKGLATVVDSNIRRCWQVDASKVTFPGTPTFLSNTIQTLAKKVVQELGLDGPGVKVEACLYKLLFYEEGGHFTFHRDTEKQKGMFASLILQLPTEEGYKGGKLVVRHNEEQKEFCCCHMVSALGFCYTAFYADCLHELTKIESGTRLCLAFNLVKLDPSLDPVHREFVYSKVHRAEVALEQWLEETPEAFGGKFAIPLRHKYTEENLSFSMLKGDDSIVAQVLKECRDKNKEKWLDLHLCLVTKYQCGDPAPRRFYSRSYGRRDYDFDSDYEVDAGNPSMFKVTAEKIEFKNWITVDDKPASAPFKDLGIDLKKEVVVGKGRGPFDKPDREMYESYTGNASPSLEYWYHVAMLVAWPKTLSISIECETGVSGALDRLQNTLEIFDPSFGPQLHQIVCYCHKNISQVWGATGDSNEDSVTSRLLSLCTGASMLDSVLLIHDLLAKDFHYKPHTRSYEDDGKVTTSKVGVRNSEVVKEIAAAVRVFGWQSVSVHILELAKECALHQGGSFAELAKCCYAMGKTEAGDLLAITTFTVFETRIRELNSHKVPMFTWRQPHAKLPQFPDIEDFLKGPQEKYVHKVPEGLRYARAFGEKYFHIYSRPTNGYSAIGTALGKGRDAFCEIQKTRYFFQVDVKQWQKEQEVMKGLIHELEKVRSVVHDAISSAVTPLYFGQCDTKRQRLDTEGHEDMTNRATSSAVGSIDSKRQRFDTEVHVDMTNRATSSRVEFIDIKRERLDTEVPDDLTNWATRSALEFIDSRKQRLHTEVPEDITKKATSRKVESIDIKREKLDAQVPEDMTNWATRSALESIDIKREKLDAQVPEDMTCWATTSALDFVDSRRQRLDTEVPEDMAKRATSSRAESIDIKRERLDTQATEDTTTRATSVKVEAVDLT